MATPYCNSCSSTNPVPTLFRDVFKVMAKSKPRYTRRHIKAQIEQFSDVLSMAEAVTLLQDATLALLRPGLSKRQAAKARKLLIQLALSLSSKVADHE